MDYLSLPICSTKQKQTYYCLNNFLLRQQNTILRQYKDTRIARNVRGANFHFTLFIQQFAIVLVNLYKQWKSKFFVITVLVFEEQKRLLWTLVYEKQCTCTYLFKPKHQYCMSRIQSKNLSTKSREFERSWMKYVIPIRNSFRIYT